MRSLLNKIFSSANGSAQASQAPDNKEQTDSVPANVKAAMDSLDQMRRMVVETMKITPAVAEHSTWVSRVLAASESVASRAELAALLADGPMGRPNDSQESLSNGRTRTLCCALIEAGLTECHQVEGKAFAGFTSERLREVLLDWMRLGAWRQNADKSPLTEIARLITESSQSPDIELQTRLGLLVPVWSSVVLWGELATRMSQKDETKAQSQPAVLH